MKNIKSLWISIAVVLASIFSPGAHADNQTLAGPTLEYHNVGWDDTGIEFTALQDLNLTGFTFQNYGANDTIHLVANNAVVYSYEFLGGGVETSSTISVNWGLTAGQSYRLISHDPNNSKWTYFDFPLANSHISVTGGYGMGTVQPSYWFHFNNLTTTAPVPEPETYAMMLLGLGLLGFAARRKKAA